MEPVIVSPLVSPLDWPLAWAPVMRITLGCRCGAHTIDGDGAYAAMMEGL